MKQLVIVDLITSAALRFYPVWQLFLLFIEDICDGVVHPVNLIRRSH